MCMKVIYPKCPLYESLSLSLKEDLRIVSVDIAENFSLIPGQKLCRRCRGSLYDLCLPEDEEVLTPEDNSDDFKDPVIAKEQLNRSVEVLGCSPIKCVSERDKLNYGKRKLDEVCTAVKEKFGSVLNVASENIVVNKNEEHCCQKTQDLDRLMDMVKAVLFFKYVIVHQFT